LLALMLIGGINSATWDWRAYYDVPESASDISPIGAAFFALLLGLICLTGYVSHKRQRSMK